MSPDQAFRLLDLPLEVISNVVSHLDFRDLAECRLASKQMCDVASRAYFQYLVLLPDSTSIQHFQSVLDHPMLAACVRKVRLYTHNLPHYTEHDCEALDEDYEYGDWAGDVDSSDEEDNHDYLGDFLAFDGGNGDDGSDFGDIEEGNDMTKSNDDPANDDARSEHGASNPIQGSAEGMQADERNMDSDDDDVDLDDGALEGIDFTAFARVKNLDDASDSLPDEKALVGKNYIRCLEQLHRLPSLHHVDIHFTRDCRVKNVDWVAVLERKKSRAAKLVLILEALIPTGVTSLSIWNLQNYPDETIVTSKGYLSVVPRLRSLDIHYAQKDDEHAPDDDFDEPEVRTFLPYLTRNWLQSALHITSLHLSQRWYWGSMPGYFAPDDLEFPNLRSLRLYNYTIAHDDQLNWVFRQKSLEVLRFSSCAIVSSIGLTRERIDEWSLPTHDWVLREETERRGMHYTYTRNWADIFSSIQAEMQLQSFTFEFTDDGSLECTPIVTMTSEQYTAYYDGQIPPWANEDEGWEHMSEVFQSKREREYSTCPHYAGRATRATRDTQALQDLFQSIQSRVNGANSS